MSRYEQRRRKFMENPEISAGYWEMDAELRLLDVLNTLKEQQHLTTEELAQRMGRKREAVSHLFNAEHANPTLDTLSDLLKALHVTAEIRLLAAAADDPPIRISAVDVPDVA